MKITVRNKRLSDDEFFREREEVLAEYPTGKEVDLDEAIEYHKSMPLTKNKAKKFAEARRKGQTLMRSMSGVATLEGMIELCRYLQDEGHTDVLGVEEDTLTKMHRFAQAQEAVKEALRTGKNTLNGFPVVTHGVAGCRKLTESVDLPITLDGTIMDGRLVSEIGFAGGFTGDNSGPIAAFGGYIKDVPLETVIRFWQYRYRLMGYYEERGIPMMYRASGHVEGPRSLAMAEATIENLLAAEQGVKNLYAVAHGTSGNLAQDIAATHVAHKLTEEYLDRFGYQDVHVYTLAGHQACLKFPLDHVQVYPIICMAPILAALAGADEFITFTVDEAYTTPTKEGNAASLRCVRMMLNLWKDQAQQFDMRNNKVVKEEAEEIELETRAILERVIELGEGDWAVGAIRAFETGELDFDAILYTSRYVKGSVLQVRDAQSAKRYLDTGNLPFTKEMVDFHRRKIAERSKKQGREVDYDTVIADLSALSRGQLISSPDWLEKQ